MSMSWTDERVELLKKLWADGLSASQIANELGSVTRNAVIGKVHRLGLSGRAKSASSTGPRPRKPRAHSLLRVRPQMRGNTALAHAYELDLEPEPEMVDNIIPIGQRCSLLELNDQKCRWPIGDPGSADFFFCGGNPTESLPYCAYHSRIAYQPLTDRRRARRPMRGY
jgi:GcrA cell cycle regulator